MFQPGGCLPLTLLLIGMLAFAGVTVDVAEAPLPAVPSAIESVTVNADWTPLIRAFDGVEAVLVPPGCFLMGSTTGDNSEQPVNQQCFDAPFWIDRDEVTWAQYDACVAAGRCTLHADCTPNPWSSRETQPINCVTWFEAADYCAWQDSRLPTEAEWEYAARGPDGLIYPWGNTFIGDNAAYETFETADVGSYPTGASWVGAYDLSGNVWEWTSTIRAPYPYDPEDGRENPDDRSSPRVLRGGAFDSPDVRSAGRDSFEPDAVYYNIGFRCVRASE